MLLAQERAFLVYVKTEPNTSLINHVLWEPTWIAVISNDDL